MLLLDLKFGIFMLPYRLKEKALINAFQIFISAIYKTNNLLRARVWSSGICGEQSGTGAGFLLVLRLPLPIFIPPTSSSSQSPGAGIIGHSMADVPSGPSMDSTPHYAN
jgi:hypothetical protein